MSKLQSKIFLSKHDVDILKRYCKGCQYFNTEMPVRLICSVISWYNRNKPNNIEQIISFVKGCPCNKCLVKPSCTEQQCPIWLEYVRNLWDKRAAKLEKRWSKKNSR
jgi:hypothetical protein